MQSWRKNSVFMRVRNSMLHTERNIVAKHKCRKEYIIKSRFILIPSSALRVEVSAHLKNSSPSIVQAWYLNQQRTKHLSLSLNVTIQVGRKIQLGHPTSETTLDDPHDSWTIGQMTLADSLDFILKECVVWPFRIYTFRHLACNLW